MVRGNRSHDDRSAQGPSARRLFLLGAFGMMAGTVVQSVPSKPRSASDSKEPNRGQVPLLDFDRAYLSWRTKSASSQGGWRLIASAMSWSPHAGWSERTVLAPEVMAGDVSERKTAARSTLSLPRSSLPRAGTQSCAIMARLRRPETAPPQTLRSSRPCSSRR